jgi:heme/copper-type cytochrome/quinol oxidase subunit 3
MNTGTRWLGAGLTFGGDKFFSNSLWPGFHGFHVIIGNDLLFVCYLGAGRHFTPSVTSDSRPLHGTALR